MMSHVTVMATGSHDKKKDIEGSKTNDVIQHGNSILIL